VPTWLKKFSIVAHEKIRAVMICRKDKTAVSAKIKCGAHGMQRAMWDSRKHARAENSPSPAFVLMIIVTHYYWNKSWALGRRIPKHRLSQGRRTNLPN
jgi:hypothetical protein